MKKRYLALSAGILLTACAQPAESSVQTNVDSNAELAEGNNEPALNETAVKEDEVTDPETVEIIPYHTESGEDGIVYTIVDELAVSQPYSYSVGGDTPVYEDRITEPFTAVKTEEADGYTYFTFHNEKENDDITFGVLSRLPDLEPDIRGFTNNFFSDRELQEISVSLKFSSALGFPMKQNESRYGIWWMNYNYAMLDGVPFRDYFIVRDYEDGLIKGMHEIDKEGAYSLVTSSPMLGEIDTILSDEGVMDSEKEELQRLLAFGDMVVLKH